MGPVSDPFQGGLTSYVLNTGIPSKMAHSGIADFEVRTDPSILLVDALRDRRLFILSLLLVDIPVRFSEDESLCWYS